MQTQMAFISFGVYSKVGVILHITAVITVNI